MVARGQRFNLDLDADNWKFDLKEKEDASSPPNVIREIRERNSEALPAAPTLKSSKTGFPEHCNRRAQSAFKQARQTQQPSQPKHHHPGPSDAAILHHAAKKQGIDLVSAKQEADIDGENRQRLNDMSLEEIEEARAELMAQFKPEKLQAFLGRAQPSSEQHPPTRKPDELEAFLKRPNLDNEQEQQQREWDNHMAERQQPPSKKSVSFKGREPSLVTHQPSVEEDHELEEDDNPIPPSSMTSTTHFPGPPRSRQDYKPLDPTSATFLTDLREHYFPDLPHDPSTLSWLQDPTEAEHAVSSYNPDRTGFAPSALRFGFNGQLITPTESLEIPTTKGLHHHGDAASSAGYTVPELALLARSTLANQRCIAYQLIGRILFRLGRGDFGARGGELNEGLWTCIERERIVEVTMSEANRDGGGHMSAKTYATEALWLWRRGGGGDRGVLKETEKRAT